MAVILFLLKFLFVLACLLLIIAILLQPGRGGSLAGIGGGLEAAFGARASDTIRNITIGLIAVMFVLACILNRMHARPAVLPTAVPKATKTRHLPGHTDQTTKPAEKPAGEKGTAKGSEKTQ